MRFNHGKPFAVARTRAGKILPGAEPAIAAGLVIVAERANLAAVVAGDQRIGVVRVNSAVVEVAAVLFKVSIAVAAPPGARASVAAPVGEALGAEADPVAAQEAEAVDAAGAGSMVSVIPVRGSCS